MAGIVLDGANVTDDERAAHAKRVAAEQRTRVTKELAASAGQTAGKLEKALAVPGQVLSDTVLAPGEHWSGRIAAQHHLRVIDIEGRQAVDFLCYDAANLANRYNAANTLKLNGRFFIDQGSKLYADNAEALMTVVADTVGEHDTIGGCCSSDANYLRYGLKGTPNCRDSFCAALRPHGLGVGDIPANVNFFMYVPVAADGSIAIADGHSLPGDFVDVRAEKDVLVAISNCPQLYNPCNGWNPTPVRVIEWASR